MAISRDYLYLLTGKGKTTQTPARGNDYIYVIDISDESGMVVENLSAMPQMPNAGNWHASATQSAVATENTLICFVKECNYHVGAIDISNAPQITFNFSESVGVSGSINTSEQSKALLYGGKIYYPSSKAIGILDTSVRNDSFGMNEEATSFPIKAGGETSVETVNMNFGDNFAEIDGTNGGYGALIASAPNGEYDAGAIVGNSSFVASVTVDVPDAIVISNIGTDAQLSFKAVNNTNKHITKRKA